MSTAHRPLIVPGTDRRALRRPDLRHLVRPRLSGAALGNEIDHDELIIHKSYRSYDPDRPDEVRYFVFEFSQRNPGEAEWFTGVKVVRLLRLTRVPRYLRAGGSNGANFVFEQQRDVLAALREKQVLFLNLVAKSDKLPLVFAYGVQAVGSTFTEAAAQADESYAVLHYQLHGTYQQLMSKPLTVAEGELLARYQAEWNHVAMARGRPLPVGGSLGATALLDGNRTDVESANNQLEAFIRGMSRSHFMMSLVTVPLSPAEMSSAWHNLTDTLSEVRSDQQGARAIQAGVALPLMLGQAFGDTMGDSHTIGAAQGLGDSQGISQSLTEGFSFGETAGISETVTDGVSQSLSEGVSRAESISTSDTVTDAISLGESFAHTEGASASVTDSASQTASQGESLSLSDSVSRSLTAGESVGFTQGQSQSLGMTETVGESLSASQGQSVGMSDTQSFGRGVGVSQGESLSQGQTAGQQWNSSVGMNGAASVGGSEGFSQSLSEQLSQALNVGNSAGDAINGGQSEQIGSGARGGFFGFGGDWSTTQGETFGTAINNSDTVGLTQNWGAGLSEGVNFGRNWGMSEGWNAGESFGGSLSQTATHTGSVGMNEQMTQGQSLGRNVGATEAISQGVSHGQAVAQTVGTTAALSQAASAAETVGQGQSLSQGQSLATSIGAGRSLGHGVTASDTTGSSTGVSQSVAQSLSRGATDSVSASQSQGVSQSVAQGQSQSASESVSRSATEGASAGISSNQQMTDAWAVAMSRSAQSTGSLGAVPSFGVSVSRQTFDERKRLLGDVLEAQMRRYLEGVESGAFLYQLFLVAPDRETVMGGAGLLKSAFWGAGDKNDRIAQPFHTETEFEDDERGRLLEHFRCFTSYRKREQEAEFEISPFRYSSYITPSELAALCHPPTSEATGLLAVHDSAPVLAMPTDRQNRELYLGHLYNGERGEIDDVRFGLDVEEVTHSLITGVTGSGKTTTLLRLLYQLTQVERQIETAATPTHPAGETKQVKASILGLDWMRNMRNLASVVPEDRFRFFSLAKPEMGEFRWNLLAIPAEGMSPVEWLNAQADNFVASMNLGEFGRSLIAEFLDVLYRANRLEPTVLLPARVDENGTEIRPAAVLPAVDRASLPVDAIEVGSDGRETANVYTCPELSRLVSVEHLATLTLAKMEELATQEAARLYGTAMRDRLQSLWRRLSYFAPGGQLADMFGCDPSLEERTTLGVKDLVDPDLGLVTVLETDGLDLANRRLILGSVLLAVYRYGLSAGEGVFDHDGRGPGLHIILEEAHELFGEGGQDDDGFSVATRNALYESLLRRSRALGVRVCCVAQNPGSLPEAVTSNTSTVFVHRCYADDDRKRVFSLLNYAFQVGQHQREWRYLGEMPVGYCIARLHARHNFLESAPVQFKSDPAPLEQLTDADMVERAVTSGRGQM